MIRSYEVECVVGVGPVVVGGGGHTTGDKPRPLTHLTN